MRLRETEPRKHIHVWRLYRPDCDDQQVGLFETVAPTDNFWTYRRCDCGVKMRCETSALEQYPMAVRAHADETWYETT